MSDSMQKVLVWETLSTVSGGQIMTLTIIDMLKDSYSFCCLIPTEGMLSEELQKRNIPYVLLGDQSMPTGIKGKSMIFRYAWLSLKSIFKSLRAIRKFQPDILYAPGPAALPWSAVCGTLKRKPVIWHLHHIFLDGATKKLLNICGKWKAVKKIVAVSYCVGDQMINEKDHAKVEVLYNPVDVKKYESGYKSRIQDEIQSLIGNTNQFFGGASPNHNCRDYKNDMSIVIGHVALIQRPKKQNFVLEVVNELNKRRFQAVVLFAGECRDEDFLTELNQKVSEYQLENRAVFLGRRNDIPDFLKLIDVLIIPSSFEGFPLAGLEACAAGTPVAAADIGGSKEFIRVSGAGRCFKFEDVNDAADSVIKMFSDDNIEEYIGNGKAFANKCLYDNYSELIHKAFDLNA